MYQINDLKPELCFGLGINTQKNIVFTREATRCLQTAFEKGIRVFDTAESYGDGFSEKIIGNTFKTKNHDIFISTKVSPQHLEKKLIQKALNRSLQRLKRDYIDLYQIHWPDPDANISEVFECLLEFKTRGKIINIGVCNHSKYDLDETFNLFNDLQLFSNQIEFSISQRYSENQILNYCKGKNMHIFAYSPIGKIRNLSKEIQEKLNKISLENKLTIQQLVLNWMLNWRKYYPIFNSLSSKNIESNLQNLNLNLDIKIYQALDSLKPKVLKIRPDRIQVVLDGEQNRLTYTNLFEAIENKLNFYPSPSQLAARLIKDENIKPVMLRKAEKNHNYLSSRESLKCKKIDFELTEGRIRFWAWVIAFGWEKAIPAYLIN